MSEPGKQNRFEVAEGKPPFFKSWTGVYLFVLGNLGLLVGLFYAFTQYYR